MADKAEQYKKQNQDEQDWESRDKDGKKEFLDPKTNEWVSQNEKKKRKKKYQKEAEMAEKATKKANEPAKASKKKPDENQIVDAVDESANYTDMRKKMLQDRRNAGEEVYPHKFQKDMTLPQFREHFEA